FLAVLASSGYCYAELSLKRDIDHWIGSHVRAFQFFGGTTKRLVPKLTDEVSHLSKHVRYLDILRRCYLTVEEMKGANVFLKADWCKKEITFRVVARWLMVTMRHHSFAGISETNEAMQQLVAGLNVREFKKLPDSSPNKWFETMERSYLTALPSMPGDRELWLREEVTATFINVNKHYYSVPPSVIGQHVDVKVTSELVEIFFQGRQITSHGRQDRPGKSSAKAEHVSSSRQPATGWSALRVRKWADKIGPATASLIETILSYANCSPAGVRSCLGILTLESTYGRERLESVCRHAASLKSWTVGSIRSMLKRGLDQSAVQLTIPELILPPKTRRPRSRN
ncbi:MAG: Mu transposase domain-containing protein, partial [Terriglobia bacterium]